MSITNNYLVTYYSKYSLAQRMKLFLKELLDNEDATLDHPEFNLTLDKYLYPLQAIICTMYSYADSKARCKEPLYAEDYVLWAQMLNLHPKLDASQGLMRLFHYLVCTQHIALNAYSLTPYCEEFLNPAAPDFISHLAEEVPPEIINNVHDNEHVESNIAVQQSSINNADASSAPAALNNSINEENIADANFSINEEDIADANVIIANSIQQQLDQHGLHQRPKRKKSNWALTAAKTANKKLKAAERQDSVIYAGSSSSNSNDIEELSAQKLQHVAEETDNVLTAPKERSHNNESQERIVINLASPDVNERDGSVRVIDLDKQPESINSGAHRVITLDSPDVADSYAPEVIDLDA